MEVGGGAREDPGEHRLSLLRIGCNMLGGVWQLAAGMATSVACSHTVNVSLACMGPAAVPQYSHGLAAICLFRSWCPLNISEWRVLSIDPSLNLLLAV